MATPRRPTGAKKPALRKPTISKTLSSAKKVVTEYRKQLNELHKQEAALRKKIARETAKIERSRSAEAQAKAAIRQAREEKRRAATMKRVNNSNAGDRATILARYDKRKESGRKVSNNTKQVRYIQNVGKSLRQAGVSDGLIDKIQNQLAGMTYGQFVKATSTRFDNEEEVVPDILTYLGIFSYRAQQADLFSFLDRIGMDTHLADNEIDLVGDEEFEW